MSLKFWLGGANSDKSQRLIQFILKEADEHPNRQYLVIVPEQFGLATQRALVLGSKNQGILNIDVLSFSRFAHRISDEVGAYAIDVTVLDDVGKNLLIGMIANRNRKKLKVFGEDLDKPGYTDKLKSVISEFMQYGISPDKAYEMSENAASAGRGLLAGKLHDIAFLYREFKEYIKDRYTTVEETLDRVSGLVPKSQTVQNSVIVFDGFTGFTPVQNKLIGVLMEYALSVHVALLLEDCIQEKNSDDGIKEHELFYLSKNTMSQLGRMADERHVIIDNPYKADEHAINNKRNSKDGDVYTKTDVFGKLNNTHVFAGRNPNEEIRMVFTRIMDLIRSQGYRYRDIAILTGDLEGYRNPIEREFSAHGVPYFVDKTEPVLLNPFIEYIRTFIDIISDNYSIGSVFGFLKSGLAGFESGEINKLENYCLAVNIKGYKAWHERFTVLTDAAKADELLELNAIRERFVSKCDVFSKSLKDTPINAGSKFTVKQFSTALYLLAQSDDIEDKLKKASAEFEEAGNRKLGSEYGRIYVKIMNVLEQLCDLIPDETTDIRGFGKLLDAGLDAIRIGMIPTGMDYVQIGDLTRSRFENIKALFIVGANDGIIPKISSSPGMINENEREFLTGVDPKLVLAPTAKEDMYTQRLYIYMALNKPSDRLFVSFSRLSYGGKSLLPSYIVKKIVASDPGITIEKRPILPEYYTDEEEAFDELTDMIYPMLSGTLEKKRAERVKALMEYFLQNGKYKMRLKRLIEREILRTGSNLNDTIGSALAHAIYGKKINASITRLENYAKCAYGYFLRYGLKLKEREIFSLEARDIGNIFHDSMKEYSELMQNGGYSWRDIPDDERDSLMDRAVDHVMERYRSAKLSSSARYAYMETRIRRIMRKSAQTVCAQLKKGLFSPRYFEVDFDRIKGENTLSLTLSDDDMMRLYGRIDRIDTYESEDGIYVRIIDYKSSQHDMDLLAVYEGRQLQLLVYLNVAKEMIMKDMERDGKDLPVIPAGVLYYRMDDPMVAAKSGLTDEDIRKLIMKDLCLKGLVNKDLSVVRMMDADIQNGSTVLPVSLTTKGELRKSKSAVTKDAFDVLSCYVTERIRNMGTDILAGNIAIPEPDGNSRFTGPDCAFCPYSLICSVRGKGKSEPEEDAPEDTEETKKETSGSGDNDWITLMKKAVNNGTDEKSTNGD